MDDEKRRSAGFVAVAALIAVGIFIWVRNGLTGEDADITSYRAPASTPVSSAPQIEDRRSLAVAAENHFTARRFTAAIELYRKMAELDPKDAAVYSDLGLALHYTGQSEQAVEALKKALRQSDALQIQTS